MHRTIQCTLLLKVKPFSPFLFPASPARGTGGGSLTKRRVRAATAITTRSLSTPTCFWVERESEPISPERQRPRSGDESALAMTAGCRRGKRPSPTRIRDWSRVRRAVAVPGDRASSERRKARPRSGMPEVIFTIAPDRPEMPLAAILAQGAGGEGWSKTKRF